MHHPPVPDIDRGSCGAIVAALVGLATAGCAGMSVPAPPVSETLRSDLDPARGRAIPSLIHRTAEGAARPLAGVSHGYGASPEDYGFISRHPARRGWLVAAIDHQLPGDPPLPETGDIRRDRIASWRGAIPDVRTVRRALLDEGLTTADPTLIVGRSHGGGAAMLMTHDHPEALLAVMPLDNRRQPLPRTSRPQI